MLLNPLCSVYRLSDSRLFFSGTLYPLTIVDEDGSLESYVRDISARIDAAAAVEHPAAEVLIERGILVPEIGEQNDELIDRLNEMNRSLSDGNEWSKTKNQVYVVSKGRYGERLVNRLNVLGLSAHLVDFRTLTQDVRPCAADLLVGFEPTAPLESMFELARLAAGYNVRCLTSYYLGNTARIGPYYVPRVSACFRCSYTREFANSAFPDELASRISGTAIIASTVLSHLKIDILADLTAVQVAKVLVGSSVVVAPGSLFEFDVIKGEADTAFVCRSPRCETCGEHLEPHVAELTRISRRPAQLKR